MGGRENHDLAVWSGEIFVRTRTRASYLHVAPHIFQCFCVMVASEMNARDPKWYGKVSIRLVKTVDDIERSGG